MVLHIERMIGRAPGVSLIALVVVVLGGAHPSTFGGSRTASAATLQCYGQTSFCVTDPVIWD
jgi:hypothetical protein